MIDIIKNFHFLRPWFLLFLLIPLGLYFKNFKYRQNLSSWNNVCDKNLLNFLLVHKGNYKKISVKKYIYSGLIFASLACAGPSWKKIDIPTFVIENPVMFVQSLAPNMFYTDVKPTRLDRAKFLIQDVTDNIEQGQFGLIVYSSEPFLVTPITDDIKLIRNILPQIVPDIMPDQGDRPDRAISFAIDKFKSSGFSKGNIILLSSDVGQRFDLAIDIIQKAVQENFNIHIIDTSVNGSEKLKILSQKGNGLYFNVKNTNLTPLYDLIQQVNDKNTKLDDNLKSKYIDFGYYLLFIPLLCVLIFFRKGLLVLFLCCFASIAEASFFKNNNQEGFYLFQNNNFEQAFHKFDNHNWKGISLYKQNKLEEALSEFSLSSEIDSLYNKGVVLAKLCKYKEALDTFNQVLEHNPQYNDALYNKKLLDDLFERAKKDPKVLECDLQKNENKNNKKQNKNDEKNQDNQNQDNKQDQNQKRQGDEESQNNSSDDQNSQAKDNTQKSSDNSEDNKNNSNASNEEKINDDKGNKENNSSSANSDSGDENKSHNEKGNEDKGTEKQKEKGTVSLINAKKGEKYEKYNDEALIMEQQYRKIPDDTGGLLRKFINKEYLKGRYKNEDM